MRGRGSERACAERGLGSAGKARDEAVAAHEQGNEDMFDDLLLADDHFAHLARDGGLSFLKTLEPGFVSSAESILSSCSGHSY